MQTSQSQFEWQRSFSWGAECTSLGLFLHKYIAHAEWFHDIASTMLRPNMTNAFMYMCRIRQLRVRLEIDEIIQMYIYHIKAANELNNVYPIG